MQARSITWCLFQLLLRLRTRSCPCPSANTSIHFGHEPPINVNQEGTYHTLSSVTTGPRRRGKATFSDSAGSTNLALPLASRRCDSSIAVLAPSQIVAQQFLWSAAR
ncbi:hypothetical protein B0H17DRAFT_1050463 [Mycena rosella]|uniref:Secreted protein n=1 Tax=Mycena rosella TaxID=1033263 RepID=A0AAD7DT40_MYCRO|nr:hypothetical protein B0H17DRAFT_1050463 [Mycena rosella]